MANENHKSPRHPRQVLLAEMAKRGWTRDQLVDVVVQSNPGLIQRKLRMMMELYWHLGTNNPKYKMGGALAAAVSVALGYQDGFFAAVEHHWQLDATGADEGFDERDREDDVPRA